MSSPTPTDIRPPAESPSVPPGFPWSLAVPLAVWLGMTLWAAIFVATYTSPIPFMDDLELVTGLGPEGRTDLDFWWAPANEHRILLPRAIYMGLLALTHDFRSGMWFQVVAQSLLALSLILFARRVRGRSSLADAFFPLLLLHWGNATNFLLGMQITIAVPTVLTSAFVMLGTLRPGLPSPRAAAWMGVCTFLLPLNGGFGLTQLPPLLLWMLVAGCVALRSPDPSSRRSGRNLLAGVAACVALVIVYFIGFHFPEQHARSFDAPSIVRTAIQFLSLNLGPIAERFRLLAPLATAGFGLLALWWAFRAGPRERLRAGVVLAGIAAAVTIALSVGVARTESGYSAGLAPRYVILPAPYAISAYLALCLFGPRALAELIQTLATLALALALPHDAAHGKRLGEQHLGSALALQDAVSAGAPIDAIVVQNWRAFYPSPEGFRTRLEWLYQAGYPPFASGTGAGGRSAWPGDDRHFMFTPRPRHIREPVPGLPRRVLQENAYQLRADSEVWLPKAGDAQKLQARFGVLPNAWNGALGAGRTTDGLAFVVEWIEGEAPPRELARRVLDPVRSEADRGVQSLELELPAGPGELVLRTLNVSGANQDLDWGFWARVEVR